MIFNVRQGLSSGLVGNCLSIQLGGYFFFSIHFSDLCSSEKIGHRNRDSLFGLCNWFDYGLSESVDDLGIFS